MALRATGRLARIIAESVIDTGQYHAPFQGDCDAGHMHDDLACMENRRGWEVAVAWLMDQVPSLTEGVA